MAIMMDKHQLAWIRKHSKTQAVPNTGWLLLADFQICPGKVYLVSQDFDINVDFAFNKDSIGEFKKAQEKARSFAKEFPQALAKAA